MPLAVAKEHDFYLQRYLDTLKSHGVINTQRKVFALHQQGYEIPVELHVADMCPDRAAFNESLTNKKTHGFVAFVRDLRGKLESERAQEEMDALLAQSPAPFVAIDLEGHITRFNAAAERSFGYHVEEVLGENVAMLMNPEHAGHHDDYLRSYRNTKEKKIIGRCKREFGRHKKGFLFPISLKVGEILNDVTKEPEMFIAYISDLRSQVEVEQNVNSLKTIFSACPIGVVTIDVRGSILEANQAFLDEFGYSEEELLQQNIKKLMPREVAEKHDSYLSTYRHTRQKSVLDATRQVTAQRKNGSQFPAELSVFEVKVNSPDGSDRLHRYTGYLRNLAPENRLQRQVKANDVIFEHSDAAMVKINARGTVVGFNSAAEDVFDRPSHTILNRNVKSLMPYDIAVHHNSYLHRFRTTGQVHVIGSTRVVSALKGIPKKLPPTETEEFESSLLEEEEPEEEEDEFGSRANSKMSAEMRETLRSLEGHDVHHHEHGTTKFQVEMRVLQVPDGFVAYLRDVSSQEGRKQFVRTMVEKSFPRTLQERVTRGEQIHDSHSEISVLYMDLVNFTASSSTRTAKTTVELLNTIFSAIDGFLERYQAAKIKTIGDCYMLATNLEGNDPHHADHAVAAGQEIIRIVTKSDPARKLSCRVGIHSGEAVSGIVGQTKPAFDLWGDAVEFASEMESTGIPGQIQISAETYQLLQPPVQPLFKERLFTPTSKGALSTRVTFT